MEFTHKPVLYDETIEALNIRPDGTYIDGTAGGGGHSEGIIKKLTTGRLLSIDRDPDAIRAVTERLEKYPGSRILQGNFSDIKELAGHAGFTKADGILLDIGVSSYQLDNPERGFSYHNDAPLDMRMSREGLTAADLVNTYSQRQLSDIIFQYGEDKSANKIASAIVREREDKPIETTLQLAEIIKKSVPAAVRRSEGHPARKTFQALRIAVNGELDKLREGLTESFELLGAGGRLLVITFHSLEDRIVKQQMKSWCEGCICPKDFPVCVCGRTPQGKLVYKKGRAPSDQEIQGNPRARSARLRVFEKY